MTLRFITTHDMTLPCITPLHMITDCKSIYDSVNKEGRHIADKGTVVQVIQLRKMCSVKQKAGKARLWWVPTRNQLADALTKSGRGSNLRVQLGTARFHEESARRSSSKVKENVGSVNCLRIC